ncbi:MAG: replication factor C small subunit [Candidatus Diapherotrites archaeon]|nr:replication factor C small subunit [Candidatus Diapherotrites archaeon]
MQVEIPWVEKYRPKSLSEIVGQSSIIERLNSYARSRNVPNQLYSGPAGVGKTSSAIVLAKALFGEQGFKQNFLELNASDERGIDVVRNTIKDFARTLAFNADFKIIFLDEADALTADAQQALRRTMECYTKTARFILSCNYSSRIIEPIQSRCVIFRFSPLTDAEIKKKLSEIAKHEKLDVEDSAYDAIVYASEGDLRKAINILQGSAFLGKKITDKIVYSVSSRARPVEIRELIKLAFSKKFIEAREMLTKLMYDYGMSGEDIIIQVYRELIEMDEKAIPTRVKIDLVNVIAEYNYRIVEGANERIQLEAMLAQFMKYS